MLVSEYVRLGTFWNMYLLSRSKSDGHCALYSIISCLNHSLAINHLSVSKLKKTILDECKTSAAKYTSHFIGGELEFIAEAENYINGKIYNSGLCDLLPFIISNSLNVNVIIVDHITDDMINAHDFLPDVCKNKTTDCANVISVLCL